MPPQETELADILLAIRDRLVTDGVFVSDAILIAMRMNPPFHTRFTQYAIVLPLHQPTDEGTSGSSGRSATIQNGRFNVYVRSSNLRDESYGNLSALTDQNVGIARKLHQVYDSLSGVFLTDANGNHITTEPIVAKFSNEPKTNYQAPEWLEVMIELQVNYKLRLNTAVNL